TILTAGVLFLWAAGRGGVAADRPRVLETKPLAVADAMRHKLLPLVVFFAIGAVVFSPTYLTFFLEGGTRYSERVGPPPRQESISSNLIEPTALTTFASPYLTDLKVINPQLWPHSDGSLTNVYMGGVTTIFGVLSVVICPRSKWRWWLLSVTAFFLLCAV